MMSCKLCFLLLTLLLTSSTCIFATSTTRPHRYVSTIHVNTSQMVADSGIEEYGGDVKITKTGPVEVIPDNGLLQFEVCPNQNNQCIGTNHVCYEAQSELPEGAKSFCPDFASRCGFYMKMTKNNFWFMEDTGLGSLKNKPCTSIVMKYPNVVLYDDLSRASCSPKIEADGSVKLYVKAASSLCPLIVKNAKIKREVTSTAEHPENLGTTPESSEGMADWLIALIVIGSIAGACLIIAAIVYLYFKFIKKSDPQPATTKKTTHHPAEPQVTEKPQGSIAVEQEKAQNKGDNKPVPKLEEAPAKHQQPAEVKQELAKAKAADPQPVQKKSKIVAPVEAKVIAKKPTAVVEPAPAVKKQEYHFDFEGGNPLGFCRRMKVKSSSGRSYKKQDSMREPVRGKYTHLFILHVKDLAQHDPKYFDHNMIVSVVKNYPRAKNILEREMKLLLKSTVDEMLVELSAMREDAHKILTAVGVEIDQKKYEALKIPPAARKLVADPATPEYVKHYMFGLEFGTRIPYNLTTLEGCSLSLLFVIAIYPGASELLRRLAASYLRSNISVIEEYWDPAERTGCYFPISAILAAEQMRGDVVIADGRRKKKEAKKELVEASTQETGDTTVDKQCIESCDPGGK